MMEAQEAADYLKISYWTLLNQAKKGLVPHVRVGRRVLFSREGLDKYIEDQEAQSISNQPINPEYGMLRKIK
ncbi:MAG: helix-turn-helix domain-containing protein [Syntrophomonadaceae bacterium]|nr:helix-turn-helix domain-containing protein [Syntrophomonadaceae bacterium]